MGAKSCPRRNIFTEDAPDHSEQYLKKIRLEFVKKNDFFKNDIGAIWSFFSIASNWGSKKLKNSPTSEGCHFWLNHYFLKLILFLSLVTMNFLIVEFLSLSSHFISRRFVRYLCRKEGFWYTNRWFFGKMIFKNRALIAY